MRVAVKGNVFFDFREFFMSRTLMLLYYKIFTYTWGHLLVVSNALHEGTCQGSHPVDTSEGCNNPLITDPDNSDTNKKDK
jgi:hypothetical protein